VNSTVHDAAQDRIRIEILSAFIYPYFLTYLGCITPVNCTIIKLKKIKIIVKQNYPERFKVMYYK